MWEPCADALTAALGGIGGAFVVLRGAEPSPAKFLPIRGMTDIVEDYASTWAAFDPQIAFASRLARSTVYADTDHVDPGDPATRAFRAWESERARFAHHLSAACVLGGGAVRAGIAIHRTAEKGAASVEEQRDLAALLPQIGQALDLGFRHAEALNRRYWDGVCTTGGDEAFLLLDERGRVVRATGAALALIGQQDGVTLRGGRLGAARDAQDALLGSTVARAIAPVAALSGALALDRPSGKRALILVVYPLARERRALAPYEAAALVRIVDPARRMSAPRALLAQALGLTPRESQLAALLAEDHSLESAAATMGIAAATARVHLHRIFGKTGTSRQAELVRLIATLR